MAKDGRQVAVLWPDGRGQRAEGKFRLLTVLLQGLADEQRGLFGQQPAPVAQRWFLLSRFYQCDQVCINTNIFIHHRVHVHKIIHIIMKMIVKFPS